MLFIVVSLRPLLLGDRAHIEALSMIGAVRYRGTLSVLD